MTTVLDACQAKLERANSIVAEIVTFTEQFIQEHNQFPKPIGKAAERHMEQFMSITEAEHPPPLLAVLVGDVLHEYRSTLDHAMYALAPTPPGNRTPPFPIFEDRRKYVLPKLVKGAEVYINAVQPFACNGQEKKHPLWLLRVLNDIDKHRILLLSKSDRFTPFVRASVVLDRPGVDQSVTSTFAAKAKDGKHDLAVGAMAEGDSDVPMTFEASVAYGLFFGAHSGDAARRPVLVVLEAIRSYVTGKLLFGNPQFTAMLQAVPID